MKAALLILSLAASLARAGEVVAPIDLPAQPVSPQAALIPAQLSAPAVQAALPEPALLAAPAVAEVPARLLATPAANEADFVPQARGLRGVFQAVTQAVRGALAREQKPGTISLSQIFDNSAKPRVELVDAVGFDPGRAGGSLLSDAHKTNVRVLRVTSDIIVKHADTPAIQRELFVRNVIAEFPMFSERFDAPEAASYKRWFGRSVLVMRAASVRHNLQLTVPENAALAALAYGLGIGDLNGNGILRESGRQKTLLLDFEHALTPLRPDMKGDELTHPMPHAGMGYYHDMEDYRGAIAQWRQIVAGRQTRLRELLTRSGFSRAESDEALQTLRRNAELMEPVIERSVAVINADFEKDGLQKGLTPAQLRGLSEANRALVSGRPEMRDFVRRYNREVSNPAYWNFFRSRFPHLGAAEWKDFLDHGGLKALSSPPARQKKVL